MENEVGIYNSDFRQVLITSKPLRASVNASSKIFSHPIENGSSVNDHKIINPTEIEINMVLAPVEYRSIYQEIKQLFLSDSLLTVQTKTDVYKNVTIKDLPHEETPDVADTVIVTLKMVETFFATAVYGPFPANAVRNINQSSTIDRGEQLPRDANASKGSFLYRQFYGNETSTN